MANMEVTGPEAMGAIQELFKANPLAEQQFQNIILRQRLQATEQKLVQVQAELATKAESSKAPPADILER